MLVRVTEPLASLCLVASETEASISARTPWIERRTGRAKLIRGVLRHAQQLFEDGVTRRSAKLSQAAKPPLESRGALFERRAPPTL